MFHIIVLIDSIPFVNLVIYFPLPVEVRVVKMSSSKTSVDAGKKVRFDASAANDAGFLTSVV